MSGMTPWSNPPRSAFANPIFTGQATFAQGSAAAPSVAVGGANLGLYSDGTTLFFSTAGAVRGYINASELQVVPGRINVGSASDAFITRVGANQLRYSDTTGLATTRSEINKAVTAFTDAAAKTVFTITIPNAAHSASIRVRVTGSMGAGGAIGANEASATNEYIVTVARTAGVNAVAAISSAFGAAAANVAGAGSVTAVATLAAVSGAVGATNTIDIQVTITKSGGSSDNHTCVAHASLLNANATGVTIA